MQKIIKFEEVNKEQWDEWLEQFPDANLHHSYDWLSYQHASGHHSTDSFAYFEDGRLAALCPVVQNREGTKLTGSTPMGVPVLDPDLTPSNARKVLDRVIDLVRAYGLPVEFVWHPLTLGLVVERLPLSHAGSFALLRYGLGYHVENTLVMNLRLPEEWLEDNLSRYHRRHIKRARERGVTVDKYYDSVDGLTEAFEAFERAHVEAAGRRTRAHSSWAEMAEVARRGGAMLSVARHGDVPLSYLLCGEFGEMAFGWSQANVERYEREFSPRHLLEWEAILYYKESRFSFYEIGERYFGPQEFFAPSAKEITVSEFKERYGGLLLPKVTWYGKL